MRAFAPRQQRSQAPTSAVATVHRYPQPQLKHAGLRPSRIPARNDRSGEGGALRAYTPGFKSSATATAGGITGISLDITFSVAGTPAAGLQAVQTFMGTRRTDGVKVGTYSWQYQGKTWDAFVDGGKNSPYVVLAGNPPAHATRPYYLTPSEVAHQVTWSTNHGTIRVTDAPGAVALHDEAYFETAIVAVDHGGTTRDKLLRAFRWGWTGKGTKREFGKGTTIAGTPSAVSVSSSVTPEFTNIVKHDYPAYQLD